MDFIGIALITEDVSRLVAFYEKVFSTRAEGDSIHSVLSLNGLSLAIYSKKASVKDMAFSYPENANAGYTTLMFSVENLDEEYEKLRKLNIDFMTKPTEYPWGAKAFHFRDPDGNIIDFVQRIAR